MKVKIRSKGHPNVRLTHHKTIELISGTELTIRGTCIAGVEAAIDVPALRELSGEVTVKLEILGRSFRFTGRVNPDFSSTEKVVFRKSGHCDASTLLIHCDKGSSDVPREMVESLRLGLPLAVELCQSSTATVHRQVFRQHAPYTGGKLYLLGHSIGNWDDVSPRCIQLLQEVDIIAAEDKRNLTRLLRHFEISAKRIESYHDHSNESDRQHLIEKMRSGGSVALISDAGVPVIADPGYKLVRAARSSQIPVVSVPGANACITALMASGLPTDSFTFVGFLPRAPGSRRARLAALKGRTETIILYESSVRILKLIEATIEELGDREACLAREMTKDHEEYLNGKLSGISDELADRSSIKGEITLVIAGASDVAPEEASIRSLADSLLQQGVHPKEIRSKLSREFNIPKREVYAIILELRNLKKE